MHIGWPQGVLLAWLFIALLYAAANDRKPRTVKLEDAILRAALIIALVYWGGFFQ